jgi:hypothetical protein
MSNLGPDSAPRKRALRPRASLTVSAAMVSQLTCLALLGVDARRYLDVVVPACRPDIIYLGKLRLIELARAVEALRSMVVECADGDEERQPETANDVFRALGRGVAR